MDAPDDTPPVLTLEIGPDRVPYRQFGDAVRAFASLLDQIASDACGDSGAVEWEISVSEGSLLIHAALPETMDAGEKRSVCNAIQRPTKSLRRRLNRFPRTTPATRLLTGEERRDILAETHEETDLHPCQSAEYGTVEGILDTLSARRGLQFTISEPIWDTAVKCTVPDELADAMQSMWRQRVAAHGVVRYNRDGHPASIRAEEVELLPFDETPIEAYRGLYVED